MRILGFVLGLTILSLGARSAFASGGTKSRYAAKGGSMVQLLTRDGKRLEGSLTTVSLDVATGGKVRKIALRDLLSVAFGAPAGPSEQAQITADIAVVSANTDKAARERAVGELTDIGLPVLTPLLDTYKDTDMHEPYPLYRLFARIVPATERPDLTPVFSFNDDDLMFAAGQVGAGQKGSSTQIRQWKELLAKLRTELTY